MKIEVTYSSGVLGSGLFWKGDAKDIKQIRNFPARDLAQELIESDVDTLSSGMWIVRKLP